MSHHTPGPWEVHEGGKPEPSVCRMTSEGTCSVLLEAASVEGRTSEENNANARLAALAPTMLELLRQVRRYCPLGRRVQIEKILAEVDAPVGPCAKSWEDADVPPPDPADAGPGWPTPPATGPEGGPR